MQRVIKDFSATTLVAAMLTVVVSYAGSAVIIFQAAHAANLPDALTASWIWAVSFGSGITGIFLSWKMRMPIITAWSMPGAALLVVMLPNLPLAEAIGAYMLSAVIVTIIGLTGTLDLIMRYIPKAVSAGMFAGILFNFGARVFSSIPINPVVGIAMLACFILFRRWSPRYSVAAVMFFGIIVSAATGLIHFQSIPVSFAKPVFTTPVWSISTMISLGIPLALVTLTGQYISGMAVLHASGYQVRADGIMTITGICSLIMAPFGAHTINLAALTAAICTGKESHEDPSKRYVAGIACGFIYIIVGFFGTTTTALFAVLPAVFIALLAGLALIGAFTAGLAGIFNDDENIEAGIIAFLATASGIEFLGLGAPFWGLVFGTLTFFTLKHKKTV